MPADEMVRLRDAKRPAMRAGRPAPALPDVDARRKPADTDDAQPVVAAPSTSEGACDHPSHADEYWRKLDLARRHLAECPWCGELYDVGPHTGEQLLVYPEAASRFWQHGSSPRHQYVMATTARHQRDILANLDQTISAARIAQKELQDPTRQGLKRILA